MNFIKSIILIILSTILFACFTSDALDTPLLINCGLPVSSTSVSLDNRVWQSDDNNVFAPRNINTVSITVVEDTDSTLHPPFQVARLFRSSVTYTFSISSGPKFIRLYFSPTVSYNNIPRDRFSISLLANNFTLLRNFNPFLHSQQPFSYEFHITLQKSKKNLNLTFSGATDSRSSYGYINGIEIESVPDNLYINASNPNYYYVTNPGSETEYLMDADSRAFQTSFRINIGGEFVAPQNDTGGMMRAWHADDDSFMFGDFLGAKIEPDPVMERNLMVNYTKKIPDYVAPKPVYETRRIMGNSAAFNLAHNLTWRFEVDPGFDYMVRLHLREMDLAVTGPGKRVMSVYIGGLLAGPDVDIWAESGGFGIPMYKDYVITVSGNGNGDGDGGSNASKVPLMLALQPVPIADVFKIEQHVALKLSRA